MPSSTVRLGVLIYLDLRLTSFPNWRNDVHRLRFLVSEPRRTPCPQAASTTPRICEPKTKERVIPR
jgi:hypothetical protein